MRLRITGESSMVQQTLKQARSRQIRNRHQPWHARLSIPCEQYRLRLAVHALLLHGLQQISGTTLAEQGRAIPARMPFWTLPAVTGSCRTSDGQHIRLRPCLDRNMNYLASCCHCVFYRLICPSLSNRVRWCSLPPPASICAKHANTCRSTRQHVTATKAFSIGQSTWGSTMIHRGPELDGNMQHCCNAGSRTL